MLLLDEPLSALDRVLREELQLELRRIHREIGTTMICVTHDRSEALTMSDRIVIIQDGRIVQDAPPEDIYRHSGSRFVAEFLGEVNVLPMTLRDGGTVAQDATGRGVLLDRPAGRDGGEVDLVVRVENVHLHAAGPTTGGSGWRGTIREALFLGEVVRFVVDCTPHVLTARVPLDRARGLAPGTEVAIELASEPPMVFPR